MPTYQNPIWHEDENLTFFEKKLVFRAQPNWEDFDESRLPSRFVVGQSPLENRIKELEVGKKTRGKVINLFGRKSGLTEEERLERKSACENCLGKLKEPIESQKNLDTAIKDVSSFTQVLGKIRSVDLDQVDIEYLLKSEVRPFFGKELEDRLKKSQEKMTTSDKVLNETIWQMDDKEIMFQARTEWPAEEKRLKAKLKELKADKKNPESTREIVLVKNSLEGRTAWINHRAVRLQAEKQEWQERNEKLAYLNNNEDKKESDDVLELMRKQTENKDLRDTRIHRLTLDIERQNIAAISDKLSYEDKLKINNILLEAREVRLEEVRQYLRKRLDRIKNEFNKKKNLYAESGQEKKIQAHLEDSDEWHEKIKKIEEEKGVTAALEAVKDLNKRLDLFESSFEDSNNTASAYATDIEQLKGQITKQVATLEKEPEARDEVGKLKRKITDFKSRLSGLATLSSEAVIDLYQELQGIKSDIGIKEVVDENDGAVIASKVDFSIEELTYASSIEEIEFIIQKFFGSGHVDYVSHAEFEKEYRKYTSEGYAVFYKRGDEWKVILDESAKGKPQLVDELKGQFTHELLHLKYDKSKEVRDYVQNSFIRQNSQWPEIKEAFIEMVELEGKEPPTDEGWTDHYILSEIYAMQNDIGRMVSRGNDPKSKLNNLLIGAGFADALNIDDKKNKYEKANEEPAEEIYGFEGGGGGEGPGGGEGDGGDLGEGAAETSGSYDENVKALETTDRRIKELQGSEFIGMIPGGSSLLSAMNQYKNQTQELNEMFKNDPGNKVLATGINERLAELKDDLTAIEGDISSVADSAPNQKIGLFANLWNNTTFLSLDDIVQTGIDVYEFFDRRHARNKKDHAARLGMALFNGTTLGREALARQQKAEAEEVSEWQGRYETLDAWQLNDEIKSIANGVLPPNKDQLKAILRILAQKGRIDWRDENLWKIINRLQGDTHLTPGDPVILHNPTLMSQKLHTALGVIYDYDEYTSLVRQNESSYKGEMEKYFAANEKIADQLTQRLDQLLAKFDAGEKVDPIEYESVINTCIKAGKSYAENVMFHILAGIAKGLLTPDRGIAIDNEFLNNWPATQWIYNKVPPLSKKDYQDICEKYFPNAYKEGTLGGQHGGEFMNFFWTQIQNDQMVIERVIKSASERGWDHDWGRSIACMGNAGTAYRFLAGRSGQRETKETAVANSYVGAIQWLEQNAEKPETINYRKEYARMAGWLAMSEGIMDSTAYFRGHNDIATRSNASMESMKPREAPVGNHGDETLGQHRGRARSFLDTIDPYFFSMLRGQVARTDDDKKNLGQAAKNYLLQNYGSPQHVEKWNALTHIDDIYDNMDYIIQVMLSEQYMSDAQLKGIIAKQRFVG